MSESERLQRAKRHTNHECDDCDVEKDDEELAVRIAELLNHPQIDKYCMIDAYYYDFSVIPRGIQEKLQLWRDCYLIFGITTEGEMVSKWVDRWDLDSTDPIIDGKVMHNTKPRTNMPPPEVKQFFDSALLSTPVPDIVSKLLGLP